MPRWSLPTALTALRGGSAQQVAATALRVRRARGALGGPKWSPSRIVACARRAPSRSRKHPPAPPASQAAIARPWRRIATCAGAESTASRGPRPAPCAKLARCRTTARRAARPALLGAPASRAILTAPTARPAPSLRSRLQQSAPSAKLAPIPAAIRRGQKGNAGRGCRGPQLVPCARVAVSAREDRGTAPCAQRECTRFGRRRIAAYARRASSAMSRPKIA